MKPLILLLILTFGLLPAHAQTITNDDLKAIIPSLNKEDYKDAFEKSDKLLQSSDKDSSGLRGIVTYINIWSSAGMVSTGKMTYEDFEKNEKKYIGQWIVMPGHPCVDSLASVRNSLKFGIRDGVLIASTVAINQDGTSILCFEYFKFHDAVNPADWIGKDVRTGGILRSVDTNPNKSTIWICRIHVEDAFIHTLE